MKFSLKHISIVFILTIILSILFFLSQTKTLFAGNPEAQSPPSSSQSIQAGQVIFFEYCSGCHGQRADGKGPQALNLVPKPQNLRNAQFVKYLSLQRMYSSISGGVRGTSMPAFEMVITPEKRWNVIHYIKSLTSDDTINLPNAPSYQEVQDSARNPIPLNQQSVETGKKYYLSYCANCHGPRGDGNGVLAQNLNPQPRNLSGVASWGEKPFITYMTDARLYNSITNGVPGTSMQPWIGVMTDEQRWHILNFLRWTAKQELEKSEKQ